MDTEGEARDMVTEKNRAAAARCEDGRRGEQPNKEENRKCRRGKL